VRLVNVRESEKAKTQILANLLVPVGSHAEQHQVESLAPCFIAASASREVLNADILVGLCDLTAQLNGAFVSGQRHISIGVMSCPAGRLTPNPRKTTPLQGLRARFP
jgi:hypothetical protein